MKVVWIGVAFAAGVAVGVIATRLGTAPSSPTAEQTPPAPRTMDVPPELDLNSSAGTRVSKPMTAAANRPAAANAASAAQSAPGGGPATTFESPDPVVTTPGGAPIDLGKPLRDALTKQAAKSESPLELHAALENEARDDSWSYPLEAEIRNSLIPDTSNGNFGLEGVDCRSSLCEVRLSATGAQSEALNSWNQRMFTQPWAQRVEVVTTYMTSSNGRTDQITIVRRRRAPPK